MVPLEFDFETEVVPSRRRPARETERYEASVGAPVAPVRLPTGHDKPTSSPQVGARYLNYLIRRRLARGSMGLIYEALHLHLNRPVAIKFLHPALLADESVVLRFLDEARAMARIEHPGVPVVHDFGQDAAGNAYLIMERLEGVTVAEHLEVAEIELGLALEIAAQVADALAAAHRAGVIHRDLKPDNIFLVSGDSLRVKLVDFGVAHPGPDDRAGLETASGCLVGTPAFMAPEQTYSDEVGPATDIYALGCVLFELVSGRPVFDGSAAELIDAHRHRPAPELDASLPPELIGLVSRMLDKHPGRRPAQANQVARRLRDIADGLGVRWVDPRATTDQLRRHEIERAIARSRRLAEGTGAPPDPPAPFPALESPPVPFYGPEGTPQPFRTVAPDPADATVTTAITPLRSRLWLTSVIVLFAALAGFLALVMN